MIRSRSSAIVLLPLMVLMFSASIPEMGLASSQSTSTPMLGRAVLDEGFLRQPRPPAIAVPDPSVATMPEVDRETAVRIARARAVWEFGDEVRLGSVIPVFDANGAVYAYDVDFTIDGSSFGSYERVAADWQAFLAQRNDGQAGAIAVGKGFPGALARWVSACYTSVTVSATYDAPSIRGSRQGVSNFYACAWIAREIANQALGVGSAELVRVVFDGTWERLYEFTDGKRSVLVEGHEPWGWYDRDDYGRASLERLRSRIDTVRLNPLAERKPYEAIREANRRLYHSASQAWLEGAVPPRSAVTIPGLDHFTPYYWYGGCSPTSGSMVINYYDEYSGYGKLTWEYARRYEPVFGWLDCHVSNVLALMPTYMNTNPDGWTYCSDVYPGMQGYTSDVGYCFESGLNLTGSGNQWHCTEGESEIAAGYPWVFTCDFYPGAGGEGHSVACVGYDTAPDPDEYLCFNTWWNGSVPEWAPCSGGSSDYVCLAGPRPNCNDAGDAKLTALDGYQIYGECGTAGRVVVGQEVGVTWNRTGQVADHVTIDYSTDGGGSWSTVAASAPDNGFYSWMPPPTPTMTARLRIIQFSGGGDWLSSDGTYGDFEIADASADAEERDAPDGAPGAPCLLLEGANPARGAIEVRYGLPADGVARLCVYDVSGREVARLIDASVPAGWHAVVWDLRANGGERVPRGVYLMRLTGAGASIAQRMVVVE